MHYDVRCEMSLEFKRLVTKTLLEMYDELKKANAIILENENIKTK